MANLTGSRSTFPNQLDVFREIVDISPSKKVQAKRYQELKMKEVLSPAEVSELNSLMTELQEFIVTPEYTNKMLDALINLESFFLNETAGFVNNKQTEMNTYVDTKKTEMQTEINSFNYKGAYSPSTSYLKNNFVDFNDGSSNQTYICLQDCMEKEPSSNPLFWRKLTIQGTKGDTGLSGVNFIFKGTWDNGITFMKDEAVRFGGMLFVSKIDNNVGNSPSLTADTNYWFRAMDITVTVRKMVGTRNIVSQASTVNFITGEISSFNPDVDSLDVYMNSTRLTKGIDYNINLNNQAIDKIGGTWDGSMGQPVFFEFVVTKNIINDLIFKDGSALSNGSVTRNKLDVDTQAEINKVGGIESKVGSGALTTTAQNIVGAINEHEGDISSVNSQLAQDALNLSNHIGAQGINAHGLSGKIIHSAGSNENGEWIRFEDGTQICTRRMPFEPFTANTLKSYNLSFPASFIGYSYSVTLNVLSAYSTIDFAINMLRANNFSDSEFTLHGKFTVTQSYAFAYIAIGRWK